MSVRCDGCGAVVDENYNGDQWNSSNYQATYCRHCDALRRHFAISPGEHEHYRLHELADRLAEERKE